MKTHSLTDQQINNHVGNYQRTHADKDIVPVIESLHGLIHSIAQQRPPRGAVTLEDMVSEGMEALLIAAQHYDTTSTESFTGFARNYIADRIRCFYTRYCLPLSRPGRSTQSLSIEPIDAYIYDTIDSEGNEVAPILPEQLVVEMQDEEPEPIYLVLQRCLDTLSPLERAVMERSFGDEPDKDEIIAHDLYMTVGRLRQLRHQTLRKLYLRMQN